MTAVKLIVLIILAILAGSTLYVVLVLKRLQKDLQVLSDKVGRQEENARTNAAECILAIKVLSPSLDRIARRLDDLARREGERRPIAQVIPSARDSQAR